MYGPAPDISSSEDEYFAYDPDYELYKEKARKITLYQELKTSVDKEHSYLKEIYNNIISGRTTEALNLLVSNYNVDVDLQNGWTPLLLGASLGKAELVAELTKKGADVNSAKDSLTALMLACDCSESCAPYEESLKVIHILLGSGADVDACDRKRKTPVMFAAYSGNLEAVKVLLSSCNRNAVDNQRWTVLFWAIYGNHPNIVEYLLEEGFSTSIRDIRDCTPIDIAREYEFEEVLKLFPQNDSDTIACLLDAHRTTFQDMFKDVKSGERPKFFLDICSILYGVKTESLIKLFSEKEATLYSFLSLTDSELLELGVLLPYQRRRILTGLYRFHKQSYSPKSLPMVQKDAVYSNIDVANAVISAVKQLTAMEASLNFIAKNLQENIPTEHEPDICQAIKKVRRKIGALTIVTAALLKNSKEWDASLPPADLILKHSRKRKMPWRKLIFSFSLASVVLLFVLRKS